MTLAALRSAKAGSSTTLSVDESQEDPGPKLIKFPRSRRDPQTEIAMEAMEKDADDQEVDPSDATSGRSYTEVSSSKRQPMHMVSSESRRRGTVSPPYRLAVRVHLVQQLSDDLKVMARTARSTAATSAVASFLEAVHRMADVIPGETLTDVAFALANALVVDNRWTNYRSDQFEGAREILSDLGNRRQVTDRAADKAILELEDLGFSTTAFSFDIETSD